MKNLILFISITLISLTIQAQEMKSVLEKYNDGSVPYISVEELRSNYNDYTILDTRKKEEYEVSHLPGAIWVGEKLDKTLVNNISKEKPIVVYCSIGVRSENYGEELLEIGYKKVWNLYGSIFFWKDAGYTIVDVDGNETNLVHVFSKEWGKYLRTGKKVY